LGKVYPTRRHKCISGWILLVKWVALGFVILAIGAILVLISHATFEREYYGLVFSKSFSAGQPLEFYWTFEGNASYRFQVETSNWTCPSPYIHCMFVGNGTLAGGGEDGLISAPYVWYWKAGFKTTTLRVCWWHFWENNSRLIETPNTSAHVDLSQLEHETYQPTELVYAGAAIIAVGAVSVLVIERAHRHETP
jgi:hypothetical protein